MFGPTDERGGSSSDPFLVSLVDFQRKFSDRLAVVLSAVVRKAANDSGLQDKLGSFIDYSRSKVDLSSSEGQQSASLFDLQYLLGYMQRNAATLAGFLGVEKPFLVGVATDLLEIRNLLAHGLYKDDSPEEKSKKTEKFIQRGLTFVEQIMDGVIDDGDAGEDIIVSFCSTKMLQHAILSGGSMLPDSNAYCKIQESPIHSNIFLYHNALCNIDQARVCRTSSHPRYVLGLLILPERERQEDGEVC